MNHKIVNENEIVKDYINNITITKLCKKYHIGKLRVKEILHKNNVELRKGGKILIKRNFIIDDWRIEKYPEEEGYHYIAVYKDNGKEFDDAKNKGGNLTTYINKMNGITIPSLYERRIYYQETGNYWWEQWFDIIKRKKPEIKKCPYCEWSTIDIENKSGAFEVHLKEKHNKSKSDYLKEYPDDIEYFLLANKTKNLQFSTNEDDYVICQICGKKLRRIDSRHLKFHNITQKEYKERYSTCTVSKNLHNLLSEITINANMNMVPYYFSKPELEIMEIIKSYGMECYKDRKILKGKELDVYIPSKQIAIEYNGNFYHTEVGGGKGPLDHLRKTEMCKENGVKLIQIFEDEYINHKDIVINKIKHILNAKINLPKISGRKCIIKKINASEAKSFLNTYHIQGFASSSIYYGAYYENKLIGVMTFKKIGKDHENEWELTRFASDYNYVCQGVGGKLFKHFIKENNPILVKSFADRRWTIDEENNIYIKLGFSFDGYTKPDYKYYHNRLNKHERYHKFGFKKELLIKKYPNSDLNMNMTEKEMARKLGFDRVWDCGLIRYIWENDF